jgi:hypothetical protein
LCFDDRADIAFRIPLKKPSEPEDSGLQNLDR